MTSIFDNGSESYFREKVIYYSEKARDYHDLGVMNLADGNPDTAILCQNESEKYYKCSHYFACRALGMNSIQAEDAVS
jgi:hypothetical protein